MDLFLPKPFAATPVLDLMLDCTTCEVVVSDAILADHMLMQDAAGVALALVPHEGGKAEGVLLKSLAAPEGGPLAFVMAAFGAEAATVCVEAAGRPRQAIAFLRPAAGALEAEVDPAHFTPERQALVVEIVREIASHVPDTPPDRMPKLLHGIGFRAIARVRGRQTSTPVDLRDWAPGVDDVERLSKRSGYARYFSVEEHTLRHRRFDGSRSGRVDRSVLVPGDAVTVVPFDPVRQSVLVVEQLRPGPLARRDPNPWLLEPIAGRCDRLEAPEETARREAMEEAGIALGRLVRLPGFYSTPGITSEYMTAFIAEADLSAAGGIHGLDEEGEDIRSHVLPFDAAMAGVSSGEINVGPLVLSLLWLQANRERLTREWRSSSAA
jgi:ADP-ribose pyrophosphatase